jgi:hypothetical protein
MRAVGANPTGPMNATQDTTRSSKGSLSGYRTGTMINPHLTSSPADHACGSKASPGGYRAGSVSDFQRYFLAGSKQRLKSSQRGCRTSYGTSSTPTPTNSRTNPRPVSHRPTRGTASGGDRRRPHSIDLHHGPAQSSSLPPPPKPPSPHHPVRMAETATSRARRKC